MTNVLLQFLAIASASILTVCQLCAAPSSADEAGWRSLVDSPDLHEWETFSGSGTHVREGDVIVGTSKLGRAHTFFATKDHFSDFILELEMQMDSRLNSGIQIRCADASPDIRPMGGYHVDIDPTIKRETGIIWRNTLERWKQRYPRSMTPQSLASFRNGDWNRIRIEAIGPSIRVWVNEVQTTDLVDTGSPEGFIGLHIHPIGNEAKAGLHVMWRDIRIKTTDLEASRWPTDPQVREISYLVNELTEAEKRLGYRLLWDGKSFEGWRNVGAGEVSDGDWKIEDGALTVIADESMDHKRPPGGLMTKQLFGNFELEWEFRISKGADGGIQYLVGPQVAGDNGIGLEYRMVDDANHKSASMGTNGNRKLASATDLVAPRPLTNQKITMEKVFWGIGHWNKARVVSRDGKVEHWLNNEKVVEFDRNSQLFDALIPLSMHAGSPNYGKQVSGHILLRDSDQDVSFRSIKIREF